MGGESREVGLQQEKLRQRLADIDQTVRNLLDNITAANRELVDQRLLELAGERRAVEEKIDSMRGLALTAAQTRELVDHTARFIAGLKDALSSAPLDQRQAAIRRCVDDIQIDHAHGELDLVIRKLPLVAGGTTTKEIEHIKAKLCVSPAPRKAHKLARKSQ